MKYIGRSHTPRDEAKEADKGFLELLLSFLKAPLPISQKRLDDRFKYQYAFDRFRTDKAISDGGQGKQSTAKSPSTKTKRTPILESMSKGDELEMKRSKLFSDQAIGSLSSFTSFSYSDARLFFRLNETYSAIELKSAYHEYVMLHHPDLSDPGGVGLAEKKVQLANIFNEMLQRSA